MFGSSCVREMIENELLKGVSRSFYLTLRLLPGPMRRAASLGYLLARTSDTLADAVTAPMVDRLSCLKNFSLAVEGREGELRWPTEIVDGTSNPKERFLLGKTMVLIEALEKIPTQEARHVKDVLGIIISGQVLDLERFCDADAAHPLALLDDVSLEDYAWRVAGSVGEFWTHLGFLTLGEKFSFASESELLRLGRNYGMGLQLVNILRDLPEDLAQGRCYLPVKNPTDRDELLREHARWCVRASAWIQDGKAYAASLRSRRARVASQLPALLAEKTLQKLNGVRWAELESRIKIPRSEVYRSLIGAFLH